MKPAEAVLVHFQFVSYQLFLKFSVSVFHFCCNQVLDFMEQVMKREREDSPVESKSDQKKWRRRVRILVQKFNKRQKRPHQNNFDWRQHGRHSRLPWHLRHGSCERFWWLVQQQGCCQKKSKRKNDEEAGKFYS